MGVFLSLLALAGLVPMAAMLVSPALPEQSARAMFKLATSVATALVFVALILAAAMFVGGHMTDGL